MYSEEAKEEVRRALKKWEEQVLPEWLSRIEREEQFTTLCGIPEDLHAPGLQGS